MSETFASIAGGAREVADKLRDISAEAGEQSAGLAQISQAVQHIDELTQQNVQMGEPAMHRSTKLSQRADRLSRAVGSLRLRQDSADEALRLVQRVVELQFAKGDGELHKITHAETELAGREIRLRAQPPLSQPDLRRQPATGGHLSARGPRRR